MVSRLTGGHDLTVDHLTPAKALLRPNSELCPLTARCSTGSATRAVNPAREIQNGELERHRRACAPDIQKRRPFARSTERSEGERETGLSAPSTKQGVKFAYRLR